MLKGGKAPFLYTLGNQGGKSARLAEVCGIIPIPKEDPGRFGGAGGGTKLLYQQWFGISGYQTDWVEG